MKELFEKAKTSRQHYDEYIDLLLRRYLANPGDKQVISRVAELRQVYLWPDNQYAKEPSLLNQIPDPDKPKETFERFKTEDNYKKFVDRNNKSANKNPVVPT